MDLYLGLSHRHTPLMEVTIRHWGMLIMHEWTKFFSQHVREAQHLDTGAQLIDHVKGDYGRFTYPTATGWTVKSTLHSDALVQPNRSFCCWWEEILTDFSLGMLRVNPFSMLKSYICSGCHRFFEKMYLIRFVNQYFKKTRSRADIFHLNLWTKMYQHLLCRNENFCEHMMAHTYTAFKERDH